MYVLRVAQFVLKIAKLSHIIAERLWLLILTKAFIEILSISVLRSCVRGWRMADTKSGLVAYR